MGATMNGDSGVQDLTKAHNFSIKVDPVMQLALYRPDGALQGLLQLLASWESDQKLK